MKWTTNLQLEELYHDSNLPNKHNLYCGGRSTWEVVLESEDFKDNNNPPNNDITDPAPDFIIVGGAASEVDYALVMDISRDGNLWVVVVVKS